MHFKKKSQTRNLPYFGNENFNETVESYHLNNRKPGGDVQVEFWISKLHQIPYHVAGKVTYPTIGKKTRISKKLPWKGLCSFQMRVQVSKMDESCVNRACEWHGTHKNPASSCTVKRVTWCQESCQVYHISKISTLVRHEARSIISDLQSIGDFWDHPAIATPK